MGALGLYKGYLRHSPWAHTTSIPNLSPLGEDFASKVAVGMLGLKQGPWLGDKAQGLRAWSKAHGEVMENKKSTSQRHPNNAEALLTTILFSIQSVSNYRIAPQGLLLIKSASSLQDPEHGRPWSPAEHASRFLTV